MSDDQELVRRALDRQARARDYRTMDLPGYMAWSEQRLRAGVSDALIAHMDATSMHLLPEEAASITTADFDAELAELQTAFDAAA